MTNFQQKKDHGKLHTSTPNIMSYASDEHEVTESVPQRGWYLTLLYLSDRICD